MKTGPVMEIKRSPEHILFFLLVASLCPEVFNIQMGFYIPRETMSWTDARLYCQKNHADMVTMNIVDSSRLSDLLVSEKKKEVWIGLRRDPENVSVWKWINLRTGEGLSGDDVSQSTNWANGQQNSHCVLVIENLWYSRRCSEAHIFYCTDKDQIKRIHNRLNWHKASKYCQDLRNAELSTINETSKECFKHGWIGLYREAGDTWNWIGQGSSRYRNWAPGQPENTDCGTFNASHVKWHSKACSKKLHFVCFDDNLILVKKRKTWDQALLHCHRMETPCVDSAAPCMYRHSLVTLQDLSEYNYVRDRIYRATTDEVWIGLRFLGGEWWWVNGEEPQDQGTLPICPPQGKRCGALSKYSTDNWITGDCSERRNFLCIRQKLIIKKI